MTLWRKIKLLLAVGDLKSAVEDVVEDNSAIIRQAKEKGMINWIVQRLSEASTWRGLIGAATAFGLVIEPAQADKIIAAGLALIGLINVLRSEKK